MPFSIVRQDITRMKVDAIVNAANTDLMMGGGVCGAIFYAAGAQELQEACNKAAPIKTGGAAITPGFHLPAKYVIHAAGPIYSYSRREQCAAELRSAYTESLKLAVRNQCESIAFPLISSGIYGYPKAEALKEATAAIRDFLNEHDIHVYLAVFDKASFVVSEQLMGKVESYIDGHYIREHDFGRDRFPDMENRFPDKADASVGGARPPKADAPVGGARPSKAAAPACSARPPKADALPRANASGSRQPRRIFETPPLSAGSSLDERIRNLDEPFRDALFRLIDQRGRTDADVYKKANIDRRLFSKIRSVRGYTPKKTTILALAIALELNLSETDNLLERAGYALSHASKFDVIVEYFIVSGNYNIFDINEVLFKYDQPLLGE